MATTNGIARLQQHACLFSVLGRCRRWEEGSRSLRCICFHGYAVGPPQSGGKGVVLEKARALLGGKDGDTAK